MVLSQKDDRLGEGGKGAPPFHQAQSGLLIGPVLVELFSAMVEWREYDVWGGSKQPESDDDF